MFHVERKEHKIILVPTRGQKVRTEVSSFEFIVNAENSQKINKIK